MSDPLHVLRVADVPNHRGGGMSRAMHLTGDYMREWGHHIDYLWAEDMPRMKPQLRRFTTPLYVRRYVRERTLAGQGWDAVEVHEPLAAWVCNSRLKDRRMPPVVAYSHGIEARHHQADLAYRKKCGIPISLKEKYSPLSVIWQAEYALQWAAHRLVTNNEDKAYIRGKWGAPEGSISVIPTGIIPSYTEAGEALARQGWSDDRYKKVLFLATWILRKGTRDLALAMNELLAKRPDVSFTVAGCGVGEEVVRQQFDAGVQEQLTVLPRVDGEAALQKLYAESGIFVLPSYFEGQPLSMVEAAALHCSLVMTDACGMKDFLDGGANGIVVPVGDSGAIRDAVNRLIDTPAQARALGAAASKRANSQTWERTAQTKIAAYRTARDG